jgi:hypothetical protein
LGAVLGGFAAVLCGFAAVLCGFAAVLCGFAAVLCGFAAVLGNCVHRSLADCVSRCQRQLQADVVRRQEQH